MKLKLLMVKKMCSQISTRVSLRSLANPLNPPSKLFSTKDVRAGDLMAAERIRAAKSALKCKQIGNSVLPSTSWHQDTPKVMEEIVSEKVKQISEMKKKIVHVYTNEKVCSHSVYGAKLDANRAHKTKGVAGAKCYGQAAATCCRIHSSKHTANKFPEQESHSQQCQQIRPERPGWICLKIKQIQQM